MPIDIRLPEISADMKEADLLAWLVAPGDHVKQGDILVEIETDKATVELESPATGVVLEILVPAGTSGVPVGQVLARLSDEAEATEATEAIKAKRAQPEPAAATQPARVPSEPEPPAVDAPGSPVAATALARRLAERAGLDLAQLEGSGAGGRILKADVERGLARAAAPAHEPAAAEPGAPAAAAASAEPAQASLPAGGEVVPHSRMRRTIAQRLSQAKREMPHFYLSVACEVSRLLAARRRLNEQAPELRVSLNDFVIRAAALALREVPEANASWGEDAILRHAGVDISVAVATEGGLVTPIVRDADCKGLAAIAAEMRDLAERARAGRLQPREYQGGSFSVSNLGMYGIESVYAIVNPPQSCILGVGAASPQPVVRDGALAVGSVMTCTLSADHRVVDGATGAKLLAAIRRRLEDPIEMAF